jgi:hypothetical protein
MAAARSLAALASRCAPGSTTVAVTHAMASGHRRQASSNVATAHISAITVLCRDEGALVRAFSMLHEVLGLQSLWEPCKIDRGPASGTPGEHAHALTSAGLRLGADANAPVLELAFPHTLRWYWEDRPDATQPRQLRLLGAHFGGRIAGNDGPDASSAADAVAAAAAAGEADGATGWRALAASLMMMRRQPVPGPFVLTGGSGATTGTGSLAGVQTGRAGDQSEIPGGGARGLGLGLREVVLGAEGEAFAASQTALHELGLRRHPAAPSVWVQSSIGGNRSTGGDGLPRVRLVPGRGTAGALVLSASASAPPVALQEAQERLQTAGDVHAGGASGFTAQLHGVRPGYIGSEQDSTQLMLRAPALQGLDLRICKQAPARAGDAAVQAPPPAAVWAEAPEAMAEDVHADLNPAPGSAGAALKQRSLSCQAVSLMEVTATLKRRLGR